MSKDANTLKHKTRNDVVNIVVLLVLNRIS